ncbi:arabinose-5-phosphate isomerase [Vigna unguiculata]|uniref:Arabinose-5-phosphate isomerase n=1 Tax=Vigna unguiculata TaxID=3917 RepID=A0A4D6LE92_VIGUN|nr:arabinose-5-phosphate isomerase [Vigna unguiculata]
MLESFQTSLCLRNLCFPPCEIHGAGLLPWKISTLPTKATIFVPFRERREMQKGKRVGEGKYGRRRIVTSIEKKGTVFFIGVGKSGFVAHKISQMLVSLGIRSAFLSPVDALHGDIGILTERDVLVLLSKSGTTEELIHLVPCASDVADTGPVEEVAAEAAFEGGAFGEGDAESGEEENAGEGFFPEDDIVLVLG